MRRRRDKILNNSYNKLDKDYTAQYQSPIKIAPSYEHYYKERTASDIVLLETRKRLRDIIYKFYLDSPYYDKYYEPFPEESEKDHVKVYKRHIRRKINASEIYYYFKDRIDTVDEKFSPFEVLLAIGDFFELDFKLLWDNVIPPKTKESIISEAKPLRTAENVKANTSKKLF